MQLNLPSDHATDIFPIKERTTDLTLMASLRVMTSEPRRTLAGAFSAKPYNTISSVTTLIFSSMFLPND